MSNMQTMEDNVIRSFNDVKRDISTLSKHLQEHKDMMKTLNNNQKILLERIRALEKVTKIPVKNNKVSKKNNQYVGAVTSKKLHDKNCPFAKNIKPKNKVIFISKTKAKNEGYKLCDCLKKG